MLYALAHKALEQMVCRTYDRAMWDSIRRIADVDLDKFITSEGYPRAGYETLRRAAAFRLGLPAEEVSRLTGREWMGVFAETYGPWMRALGGTLPEFLRALPNALTRMTLVTPDYGPPRYACIDETDRSVRLVIYESNPLVVWFALGLLEGIARHFGGEATVVPEGTRSEPQRAVFRIEWQAETEPA